MATNRNLGDEGKKGHPRSEGVEFESEPFDKMQ